jgi:epoxyqueuosine reductase
MTLTNNTAKLSTKALCELVNKIRHWGKSLGFQDIGITDTDLTRAEQYFNHWLKHQLHGDMDYMWRHGSKRTRPAELEPGTLTIISARMDYFPEDPEKTLQLLTNYDKGYISRYALGRDYHKLIRKRLQQLVKLLQNEIGSFGYRVFTDSAPVLEKPLAEKAGLGWIGKHSNLLHKNTGSWFFLGEIFTDLPLPVDKPSINHCGSCNKCMTHCPTDAIIEPYVVDSRLCISYLTIESRQAIPLTLRPKMGNRIYGCDDCQLYCPWNRFAEKTTEKDYFARRNLDSPELLTLFDWTELEFLSYTEGSPIRRIGHNAWLRNIAVALGNALRQYSNNRVKSSNRVKIIAALRNRLAHPSELVREHVIWALEQDKDKSI